MEVCERCGAENDSRDSYCSTCGAELSVPSRNDVSLKKSLQAMDDWNFEHFVADLWERQGWTAEVEQQSMDAGVDVRATKTTPYQQKILIQAKRYGPNTTIGGPDIQQYASLKNQEEGVDKVIVVSTGEFTSSAEERARELNVKTLAGDDVVDLVRRLDAENLVAEYVGDPQPGAPTGETPESATPTVADSERATESSGSWLKSGYSWVRSTATQSREVYNEPIPRTVWTYTLALGAVVSLVFVPASEAAEGTQLYEIGTNLGMIGAITAMVSIYFDSKTVLSYSDWDMQRRAYILAAFVPFLTIFAAAYYFYKRREESRKAADTESPSDSEQLSEDVDVV